MKTFLIIYSYVSFIVAFIAYHYFDIAMASYFQEQLNGKVWLFFRSITESGEGLYWIIPPGLAYLFYRFAPLSIMPFSSWLLKHREEDMRVMGFVAFSALLSGFIVNVFKIVFGAWCIQCLSDIGAA